MNPLKSDSTGSVVAFDGDIVDFEGEKYPETFLEISDCHHKVRLHITSDDTRKQFISKLKLLNSEIDKFIKHLENEKIILQTQI